MSTFKALLYASTIANLFTATVLYWDASRCHAPVASNGSGGRVVTSEGSVLLLKESQSYNVTLVSGIGGSGCNNKRGDGGSIRINGKTYFGEPASCDGRGGEGAYIDADGFVHAWNSDGTPYKVRP